ncbi:hypothetical protein [Streptomyces sp. LUP30]|uniref:hypothetical protein n=1 Tax=Streptomyces sp. LUP30 TaxID=1890285 RepID=UPI00159F20A4|nr:hypothetical protein [Streptomyces sp. LUP30]
MDGLVLPGALNLAVAAADTCATLLEAAVRLHARDPPYRLGPGSEPLATNPAMPSS